jgi:hypothetical protein
MMKLTRKNNKYPKIPPCEQYDGEHMKYKRNDKTFCRRKLRRKKESIEESSEEVNEEINYTTENIDLRLENREEMKSKVKWVYLFGLINQHEYNYLLSEYKNNELSESEGRKVEDTLASFCTQMKFFVKALNYEQIIYITKSLKTSVRFTKKEKVENEDKRKAILIQRLEEVLSKYMDEEFISIIERIDILFTIEKIHKNMDLILNLIYNILVPKSYTIHTELDISERMYKTLIKRKRDMTIDPESNLLIISSMEKKLNHCIFMNHFKNNCLNAAVRIPYRKFNPVDICASSVITSRGFSPEEINLNLEMYSKLPNI